MPIDQAIRDGRYERSSSRLSVCRVDCCTFLVELDGALIVFDPDVPAIVEQQVA